MCPPAIELLTNSSASDTPTKNNKLLQARPKQQTAVSALNLRGVCVRSVGTHLLLPPSYHYTCTQFSPACTACLLQREPTAAITSKSDFPPPRQPNENNKSLTLTISACLPQFAIPFLLHRQFYARQHQRPISRSIKSIQLYHHYSPMSG